MISHPDSMVVRPVVAPSAIQEHLDAIMDKEAKFVAGLVVALGYTQSMFGQSAAPPPPPSAMVLVLGSRGRNPGFQSDRAVAAGASLQYA